ncbi:hypothetical protein DVA76_18795 [Acinetobacter baumannii]|nr:hypothetical protein DVA76_18795 [Acinetobacter baumannii]
MHRTFNLALGQTWFVSRLSMGWVWEGPRFVPGFMRTFAWLGSLDRRTTYHTCAQVDMHSIYGLTQCMGA